MNKYLPSFIFPTLSLIIVLLLAHRWYQNREEIKAYPEELSRYIMDQRNEKTVLWKCVQVEEKLKEPYAR